MPPVQFVKSGDVDLAVYAWNAPAPGRPTVVLVHGYPDSARVWAATAGILAARYHVVAYDVRGSGLSSAPGTVEGYRLEQLVADLAAVVDALRADEPVHVVGHDWGSMQSWEAVTTVRLNGRIASFTSVSGPCIDHAAHWVSRRLRSGSVAQMAAVFRQLARSWYIGAFRVPGLGPALWKLGMERRWPALLKQFDGVDAKRSPTQSRDGGNGVNLYRANFIQRLHRPQERRTNVPVQVIVARRDRFMIPDILEDLPQWVPNLWQREIDSGHWVPLSHPRELAAMAGEFIELTVNGTETPALRRARRR